MLRDFFTQRLKRGIVRRLNNLKIARVAGEVVRSSRQPDGAPIAFFKASTGIDDLSWNSGVGDAFRGGFVRGLSLGLDWITCGQMGALAAAYCLETKGPQEHHYTLAEFIERYRSHFDDQGKLDVLVKSKSG